MLDYNQPTNPTVEARLTADIAPMPTAWRRRSAVRRRGGACGGPLVPMLEVSCVRGWRRSPAGRLAGGEQARRCARRRCGRFRQHAGVGVGGQDDGGVAELVLHDLEVGSRGQGDGGGAVPQPVQRDRRQPGGGDQLREQPGHPVPPERSPGHGGTRTRSRPTGPGGGPLGLLPDPVLTQRRDGGPVQGDDPASGIALRRPDDQPAASPPAASARSAPASRPAAGAGRPWAAPGSRPGSR
jgi:hypothetical protein